MSLCPDPVACAEVIKHTLTVELAALRVWLYAVEAFHAADAWMFDLRLTGPAVLRSDVPCSGGLAPPDTGFDFAFA